MGIFSIQKQAAAGTLESSDIQIIIDKNDGKGISIHLKSSVEKQYGRQIRETITRTLDILGVTDAKVDATDKGALDCTIIARTMAAVHRASGIVENYDWKEIETWNV